MFSPTFYCFLGDIFQCKTTDSCSHVTRYLVQWWVVLLQLYMFVLGCPACLCLSLPELGVFYFMGPGFQVAYMGVTTGQEYWRLLLACFYTRVSFTLLLVRDFRILKFIVGKKFLGNQNLCRWFLMWRLFIVTLTTSFCCVIFFCL